MRVLTGSDAQPWADPTCPQAGPHPSPLMEVFTVNRTWEAAHDWKQTALSVWNREQRRAGNAGPRVICMAGE